LGHDQRFKELLRLFLQPFLEYFFPDVASRLDLASPEFVDKELFEDPPEGTHRVADLVARVATRGGESDLLLVHIEVQAEKRSDVPPRMFDYYALLRRTYRLPVVPLVVYLRGGGAPLTREVYREDPVGLDTLRFQYHRLVLAQLDAETHLRTEDALLAGLAALMDRSKVNDPLLLRLSMLDRIGKSDYDPYRKFLLANLVEVYYELRDNEVERFERALARPEFKEAKKMATSHVDRIMEEGREEGRQEGRQEGRNEGRNEGVVLGKQQTLLRLLRKKFGDLPTGMVERVQAIASAESLDYLLDQVLEARTLDEMDLPDPSRDSR